MLSSRALQARTTMAESFAPKSPRARKGARRICIAVERRRRMTATCAARRTWTDREEIRRNAVRRRAQRDGPVSGRRTRPRRGLHGDHWSRYIAFGKRSRPPGLSSGAASRRRFFDHRASPCIFDGAAAAARARSSVRFRRIDEEPWRRDACWSSPRFSIAPSIAASRSPEARSFRSFSRRGASRHAAIRFTGRFDVRAIRANRRRTARRAAYFTQCPPPADDAAALAASLYEVLDDVNRDRHRTDTRVGKTGSRRC